MQNLSTLSTSFLLIMSQWRDTLTALHLVDRTALTTAWTACWELLWRTEDTIRPWGMLAEEEGGVRGWICDVMRPIRQLVYLASVRGPLMAAPASYQYIVSITLPPYQHAHTHTHRHLLCLHQETSFPSVSPARTRSMKNGCHANTQKWLLKTRGEGK